MMEKSIQMIRKRSNKSKLEVMQGRILLNQLIRINAKLKRLHLDKQSNHKSN